MSVDSSTSRRSTRITRKSAQVSEEKTRLHASLPQRDGVNGDVLEIVSESDDEEAKPPIRRSRNIRERSTDLESDSRTVEARDRRKPSNKSVPRPLQIDGENESTPRPLRRQITAQPNPATTVNPATSSNVRRLPLEIARERTVTTSSTHDSWYPNMRTGVLDDADSDTSNGSRRSRRLERRPQKPGGSHSWLFSDPSSSSD
ncbi:hypothetical protein PAXINDRAFT_20997 [Paxillus involutus ATCC 200175]|uniref:Uncharacterized protein n=1 Tax=Paxillus involutus ATCC 200175 TaxID=664439 RepID=A0A0C9T2N9_PAXIN|nr:hypothetical protein PAXINDRAFT_20997 [Paxillus involutus ATCC 200175]